VTERLYLLDGTLLFFRALHGVPDRFADDQGRSVNGVRGYVSLLMNLLTGRTTSTPVAFCVAAFDESLTTCWRNVLYPDYKANRPPANAGVLHQLHLCRTLTAALGIPVLADLEYEADDFIATLARLSRQPVKIVSRDKDLQQLLAPTVVLMDPKDWQLTTAGDFVDGYGFEPVAFPDYQALAGDSVDNVPGVPGIGPKSARRLIETFGTLERLYGDSADWSLAGVKVGSRAAEQLRAHREQAFLYRRILKLDDRVELPIDLDATRLRRPSRAAVAGSIDTLGVRVGLGATLTTAMEAYGG
jgi:5'-3' exonuclease